MDVGMVLMMQSFGYEGVSDSQVYDEDTTMALQAEEQGFDHLWVVEHHFADYAFCPDNFVYLANIAARTSRIKLATGAAILPWNSQPIRVAEKAALLDHMSGGRFMLGIGRGLSRHEFEGFGIEMGESRERFDESAPMIIEALETGWMEEHDGKHFKQKRTEIRPRPERSFKGRTWQVAMSPESALQAAHLGLPMMAFSIKAREQEKAEFEDYRAAFIKEHATEPPRPMLADLVFCDSDADRARDYAERYCGAYLHSVMAHYEMMGEHFDKVGGYDAYGQNAKIFKEMGMEEFAKLYVGLQAWGTPDQMLRKFEERRKIFGEFGILGIFRYAGLPFEDAQNSQALFSREVLPVLKSWEEQEAA